MSTRFLGLSWFRKRALTKTRHCATHCKEWHSVGTADDRKVEAGTDRTSLLLRGFRLPCRFGATWIAAVFASPLPSPLHVLQATFGSYPCPGHGDGQEDACLLLYGAREHSRRTQKSLRKKQVHPQLSFTCARHRNVPKRNKCGGDGGRRGRARVSCVRSLVVGQGKSEITMLLFAANALRRIARGARIHCGRHPYAKTVIGANRRAASVGNCASECFVLHLLENLSLSQLQAVSFVTFFRWPLSEDSGVS